MNCYHRSALPMAEIDPPLPPCSLPLFLPSPVNHQRLLQKGIEQQKSPRCIYQTWGFVKFNQRLTR